MNKYLFYITGQGLLKLLYNKGPVIKYAFILLLAVCFSPVLLAQPNITRVEYYVDIDPGYGNAGTIAISPAKDLVNLSFTINMVPLSEGVHVVGIRSRDANGAWSLDNRYIFLKKYTTGAFVPQPAIARVEYYLDSDPGYGNATVIPSAAGKDLVNLAFTVNIPPLSEGVHVAGIRSKDANNVWGFDSHWLFLKPYKISGPSPKIKRVEYYIDGDPGYGKATSLNVAAAQDLNNLAFNINLATLTEGVHVAGVRSMDANGAWSIDNHYIFLKPYSKTGNGAQPNITRVEYYIDKDPGYGKATAATIEPGKDIAGVPILIDMTKIGKGKHKFGVRSMDANGRWGLDNEYEFTGGSLPVELVNFLAVAEKSDIKLLWRTVTESNSKQFIVQRSSNGTLFETIGKVGAAGFSTRPIDYNFVDINAMQYPAVTLYYRLMQVDNDNRFAYSPVRKINTSAIVSSLKLQYNPVGQQAVLLYTATENGKVTIQALNSIGQLIINKQITVTTGVNIINLNTAMLAQGLYTIQAINANTRETIKMMKQ